MSAVAKPPNVLCICIQIHSNTHTHRHTCTHKYTDTCIFLYFFPPSLVTNLATSCNFLIYLQRQAVNSFAVALCLNPQCFSPVPSSPPSTLQTATQLRTQSRPRPIAVSIGKFLAVSSRREKLSAIPFRELFNYHIAFFARSSSFSFSSPLPLPSSSSFFDLFMEKIVCEKYGNYAQLAASQIRIPKTLQCHFWTPRINCITNYASKAKKLNTFCGRRKRGETVYWAVFGKQLFVYSTQFCIVLELLQLDLQVSKV